MFTPIEGGSQINIQGLNCWIPPVGYVVDIQTKELVYVGVHSRSDIPEEQYWQRFPYPAWYKEVTKAESDYNEKRKKDDPPFYDKKYEEYKNQEWHRRLNGIWFMNCGRPVYMTGFYYMLLQWFNIDIGYAKFTIPHLHKTYFLQYCIEDPLCMGMIDVTKRRFLKTFMGGLFILEYVTRTKMATGAIQSKTGNDGKKVFSKAVVYPFRKFPRFFRPEYDMTLGPNPKTEMRFQQTNIRGKKAEDNIDKDELGSTIEWGSADPIYFDGSKVLRYFSDEWGKTTEANIVDRHEVIRYCLLDEEGRIIGKALYSTTVEKLQSDKDGVQEAAKELWDASDQNKREENGRTQSGLYRFFQTSDECKNFDKYGYADIALTVREILADRESVKNNLRALSARIHKEPRTIDEAFSIDADKCIFNSFNIQEREKWLTENAVFLRSIWFERDIRGKVGWRDITKKEQDFHWRVTALPPAGEENKCIYDRNIKKPGRTDIGCIAIDGYSNSQGGQRFGSRASAWIGLRFDIRNPETTGKPIGHLHGRPAIKDTLHEQVMLAAEYYGFQAWYEHNSDDYDSYFGIRGMRAFLGIYPLSTIAPEDREKTERHRGFPTTPFSLTKQNDTGIAYFESYCHLIDFPDALKDAKTYDPNNRTKSDITVSLLMLLVLLYEPVYKPKPKKTPLINIYSARAVG